MAFDFIELGKMNALMHRLQSEKGWQITNFAWELCLEYAKENNEKYEMFWLEDEDGYIMRSYSFDEKTILSFLEYLNNNHLYSQKEVDVIEAILYSNQL